ncbi:MAG: acyl-CoA dehydrogenase family protein [Azonexus sp.]
MGFIEETGAAQFWRDARITTIYEGTTGIQANDLIFRELLRDRVPRRRDCLPVLKQRWQSCSVMSICR